MSSRRLFVALVLGDELGARVAAAVGRALGVDAGGARDTGLRLYAGADLHLTLFFLGAVSAQFEAQLVEWLEVGLEGASAPAVRLTSGGAFPRPGRERILWIGLDEPRPGSLAELEARVRAACTGAGFAADERPWRAHVTVGRVRRRRDGGYPTVSPAFFELDLREDWKPTAVALVESLAGGGARAYRVLTSFPLTVD